MPKVVLASRSEARQRLLARLGVPFTVDVARIDEDDWKARESDPRKLASKLARAKAEEVFGRNPRAIVIGSDQVLALGKKIFGKPGTKKGAIDQLLQMSGRRARLLTAVSVVSQNGHRSFLNITDLVFRPMPRAEIARYVRLDQPLGCAGSFMFEKHGIGLFKRVETEDPSAIEGLPLMKLAEVLRGLGARI
jgi:septum formation protein